MPTGSPHAGFQRAIERRNVLAALAAARQLEHLQLGDALELCLLLAEREPHRFDRAAVRWHGRFALEVKEVELAESQLVLAALAGLRGPSVELAARTINDAGRSRHLLGVDQAVERFLKSRQSG